MRTCSDCKEIKDLTEYYTNGVGYRGTCKVCTGLRQRAARFSLSIHDLRKMIEDQNGLCAICKRACITNENLSIDHDHRCCPSKDRACGRCVRGLLCAKCNHGLGKFDDNRELLLRAAEYLAR